MNGNARTRTLAGMALGVLAVGAAAVGVSDAQQPARQRGQMTMRRAGTMPSGPLFAMRRGLAQLGLSVEQRQQIKSIVQAREAEIEGLRRAMRQARRGIADAIANDAGEAAIRARAAELAKVEADLAVFRAALRTQVIGVLTPEQQARAKDLRAKALERADRFIRTRKK
jgi:Spy/CpxP family protein refolding chaperone